MDDKLTHADLIALAADIAGAYVKNHDVELNNMQSVIYAVYKALKNVNDGVQTYKPTGPLVPAVPIEESVKEHYIVCLEDGKRLQMLKRHLSTVYKMTPEQYKERWGLPSDYPIVAPSYAKRRSAIAKNTGLGVTGRKKRKVVNLDG